MTKTNFHCYFTASTHNFMLLCVHWFILVMRTSFRIHWLEVFFLSISECLRTLKMKFHIRQQRINLYHILCFLKANIYQAFAMCQALCQTHIHIIPLLFLKALWGGTIGSPILQMKKLRCRKVQIPQSNPSISTPDLHLSPHYGIATLVFGEFLGTSLVNRWLCFMRFPTMRAEQTIW